MIVQCDKCKMYYDDQFGLTLCDPATGCHQTFAANDGQNNFKHYPESWFGAHPPERIIKYTADKSELDKYREWLDTNKVKV
jgi:hypothetical protein